MEEKGITITFRGDTVEFDKSVDGINKALKTLKNEMKSINKQLKLDPKNVELLQRKFANLQQQQKLAKESVKMYEEELAKLDKKDIGGKEWESLTKKLNKAEEELQAINKQMDVWGKANVDVIAFGKGLQEASKKTKKLADDLKGVSMAGMAVATALGAVTVEAGKNADNINTLAKQYNLTTEEIQKFQLASDIIDVDLNTITKSYAKLTKNMTSTSKDVQNAFKILNVSVRDANGELRDSGDVFNELILALGNVQNETEQDNLAMQIFGKSAADLGPLINGGAEQLKKFSDYLEENALIMSQDQLDALNEMNDAFDTIKATFKGLSNSIAVALAPLFRKVFDKVNKAVLKLKEVWESLSPSLQQAIPIIATIVGAVSPLLTVIALFQDKLGLLIQKIGFGNSGIGSILSKLTSPIGLVVSAIGLLYATNEEFRNSVNALAGELWDNLKPILDIVIENVGKLFNELSTLLAPIINELGSFLSNYIIPILSTLIQAIFPVISAVLSNLFGIIQKIVEWLGKLWQYLKDRGVIDLFVSAFENVASVIQTVVDGVKALFGWFGSLVDKAKEFLGINGQIGSVGTVPSGGGSSADFGGGSRSVTLNSTINVNNSAQNITRSQVLGWADVMTQRINDNLGRMV